MSIEAGEGAVDRVPYLLGSYPNRTQTFIRQEIEALRRLGMEVLPVSVNRPDASALPDEGPPFQRPRYLKGTPLPRLLGVLARAFTANPAAFLRVWSRAVMSGRWDLRRMLLMTPYFVEALLLWDICRQRRIERIHAHFAMPWSNVAWLAVEFANTLGDGAGWRWSVTVHGPHDFFNEDALAMNAKIGSVEAVVCISDHGRSQLMRQVATAYWPRLVVRRCGVRLESFPFRGRRELARPAVVMSVGRLAPEKGQLILVQAIAELRDRHIDVRCELVGDGPMRAMLVREVERLGVSDRVTLLSSLENAEVAEHLRNADLFCLPSFAEGVPVSLMEAMAIGVPVVATNVGGVAELVSDGETGRLVPAGRVDLIADALESLLTDNDLRARVIDGGRARVEQTYDLSNNVRALSQTLRGAAC